MKLRQEQITELQELVMSEGWKIVARHVEAQRNQALSNLTNCKLEDVPSLQQRVRALNYVEKIPHELISGGNHDGTER